jgi:hypothetical protein
MKHFRLKTTKIYSAKRIFPLIFLLLFLQHTTTATVIDSLRLKTFSKSIGTSFGTLGGGITLAYRLPKNNQFFLKVGAMYIGYGKLYNYNYNTKTIIRIDPDLRMGQGYLGLDYTPFRKSSLYLTTGMSYFYNSKFAAFTDTDTGFDTKDLVLSAEDFGKINFELRWNKLAPFLGFGFGRAVSKKRIGVGFELGSYYIGSPKILLDYTGVLDLTNIDEILPQVEKNMKGYAFLPYLKFSVNYNLR